MIDQQTIRLKKCKGTSKPKLASKQTENKTTPEEKKTELCASNAPADGQDDGKKKSDAGHGCLLSSLVALVLLPILYFLSIGPAILMLYAFYDYLPRWVEKTLIGVYSPIFWLTDNNDTFHGFLVAYVEWWLDIFGLGPLYLI